MDIGELEKVVRRQIESIDNVETHLDEDGKVKVHIYYEPVKLEEIVDDFPMGDSSQCTDVCGICLGKITTNIIRPRRCNHWFHKDCLKEWLSKKMECPMCRRNA